MCAVVTCCAVDGWQTVLLYPYGAAYLYGGFVFNSNWTYRTGRADVAATCTFRTAVATFVTHLWLHQTHEVSRRAKHIVRTCRYTQLATCAMLCQILRAQCSGWYNMAFPFRNLLVFYDCQSTVYFLLLCLQRSSGCQCSSSCHECSATIVYVFFFTCSFLLCCRFCAVLI